MNGCEVVDIPTKQCNPRSGLIKAVLALPPGKSLKIPKDLFKSHSQIHSVMRINRFGKKLHIRTDADFYYVWSEDKGVTQ